MKLSLFVRYAAVAMLLVGVIHAPSLTNARYREMRFLNLSQSPQSRIIQDRTRFRLQERIYWNAIEEWEDLVQMGFDIPKPDINDPYSYEVRKAAQDIIDQNVNLLPAAPKKSSSLASDRLGTKDRMLLRRYTRAGYCPDSLIDYIEGFYDLCRAQVGQGVKREPRLGIINDKVFLRSRTAGRPATLRLRMEMIRQAYDSSNRRPDTKRIQGTYRRYRGQ